MPEPRFTLGHVVSTRGALAAMTRCGKEPSEFITRHTNGDWGDLDADDRQANELAIQDGSRILSAYQINGDTRIYVITEADRSATTILLPDEY